MGSYYNGDELLLNDNSVWRDGPAKLFFDQMGIPADGNIEYGSVYEWLNPLSPMITDPLDDDDEEVGESENCRRPNDSELKTALLSIISEQEYNSHIQESQPGSDTVDACLKSRQKLSEKQTSAWGNGLDHALHISSSECSKEDDINICWGKSLLSESSKPKGGPTEMDSLSKLVLQTEVSTAVDALLREMSNMPGASSPLQLQIDTFATNSEQDFNLVSQLEWEKDVVWEANTTEAEESATTKMKEARAGWIPTSTNRTCKVIEGNEKSKACTPLALSLENDSLVSGDWEKEIIWDVDDFLNRFPQPKIPYFDATDEQLVFQKPKDIPSSPKHNLTNTSPTKSSSTTSPKKVMQPHAIKSKLLLGKAGFIQWKWQMEQQELKEKRISEKQDREGNNATPAQNRRQKEKSAKVDINFNLSNDEFYNVKESTTDSDMLKMCNLNYIRHSKVVTDLLSPFMPTYLSEDELKHFHRPQFRISPQDSGLEYKFSCCLSWKQKMALERATMTKDGHQVLLDRPSDLTGLDGDVLLIENCEEYPPLLSQVGMCSKIINYYKRNSLKDRNAHGVPHPYGETIFVYGAMSPFLGMLEPGQILSALENNMYRAPIYRHSNPTSDFLLIFNKRGFFVREFDSIFTAGQQCPLMEVPEPNSTRTKMFLKKLVLVFLYRKFSKFGRGSSPRIRLCELRKAFPGLFESTLRGWLKSCAEIKKIGSVTWVVMKDGFVLPPEHELREIVTPEQCCAYYSLLAAEQRLKDAGCDSLLSLPERPEGSAEQDCITEPTKKKSEMNELTQSKLMEELKAAPWNTTSAFVAALKGKCLLQVMGPADPTGRGEGFSYIRVAKKAPQPSSQEKLKLKPKDLTLSMRPGGTDADLRKLSAKRAKEILRNAGLPEKEISKLTRWEVIDVVRTLSTEKAKQGERDDKGIAKFCRWKNKASSQMNLERYKEDCQRLFELQNKVLSSNEPLTTDDEEEDEENELTAPTKADITEMGKNLELILSAGKTASQIAHEEEELERLELQRMMLGGIQPKDIEFARQMELKKSQPQNKIKSKDDNLLTDLINHPGRKLKISRTYKDNGKTFLRTEIVRDPVVIAAYLKIRTTKSEEFIKDFLQKADKQQRKEEKLKEKMLLGDIEEKRGSQHAKVTQMQKKRKREMESEYFPNKAAKVKAEKELTRAGRKCGACGLLGHTRTSLACPLNNEEKLKKMQEKTVAKRGRGRPPMKREGQGSSNKVFTLNIKPIPMLKPITEVMENAEDAKSSSGTSDEEEDSNLSSIESDEESIDAETEDQTMVRMDGLKMVLKVPHGMVARAQIEEKEEEEAARILLSMSTGVRPGPPKRRSSQTEREFADYLQERKYRTTAADRIKKKD